MTTHPLVSSRIMSENQLLFFFSPVVFHYSCFQYLRDSSSAPRRHLARCVRDCGRNGLGSAFSLMWKVLAYSFLILYFIHFFRVGFNHV